METSYTVRLFYGKYPYKLVINTVSNPKESSSISIRQWMLSDKIDGRVYYTTGKDQISVYLMLTDAFEKACLKWKDCIDSVVRPYNDRHLEFLHRPKLMDRRTEHYLGKYRYVIRFRKESLFSHVGYDEECIDEDALKSWLISNQLLDRSFYSSVRNREFSDLFLCDESAFIMARLFWEDVIISAKIAYTMSDL